MINNYFCEQFEKFPYPIVKYEIYYRDDSGERVGYRVWNGDFEMLLEGANERNYKADGFIRHYNEYTGWYDESPWRVENLDTAIIELGQFREEKLQIRIFVDEIEDRY